MKDLNRSLFVFMINSKAPTDISRFRKNEWNMRFMIKTAIERTMIGVEQYMIKHKV